MSKQPSYQKPWIVKSKPEMALLGVKVPMAKGDAQPPRFLRLDTRRKGITGRLTLHPVLHSKVAPGSNEKSLAVSESLKLAIGTDPITVSSASENAYRRYRFSRSLGSMFGTVATIIGALLVAVGASGPEAAWERAC